MILIIGDSNYRELVNKHKQQLEDETGETIIFKQCTTNDSLRLVLSSAGEGGEVPKVFVIGAGLNKCATKVKQSTKKKPEDVVKAIANDQNTVVLRQAENENKSIFVLVPPLHTQRSSMDARKKQTPTHIHE